MNNKYNAFMEKIDTTDELKKQLIDKINNEEMKKESLKFKLKKKIIAFISALSILTVGGTAFAVSMPEEWKDSIKEFFGIISNEKYEETKIILNEEKENNGYSLTLENYGVDSENLLITYDLKTAKEITLTYPVSEESQYLYENRIKIIDNNSNEIIYSVTPEDGYEGRATVLINKINDLEYKIYEIYTINSNIFSNDCTLYAKFELLELQYVAEGLDYGCLAEFEFENIIEYDNINFDYEEYIVQNKEIKLLGEFKSLDTSEIEEGYAVFKITNLKNTDLTTKLEIDVGGMYHTNTEYTIKITDENDNIILNKNVEYLVGGRKQEIIIPKIDMNSKLKVTVYEEKNNDEKIVIAEDSLIIDLSEFSK